MNPTSIPLTPVTSSQITAIGFDESTSTLAVQFKTGSVYHYKGMSKEEYMEFAAARSIGSYFYRNIKPNPQKYPYEKKS